MDIDIIRFNSQADFTDGLLYIDGQFVCYTLEDEERTVKKFGETRIPNGSYDVELRKEGGFHNRYLQRFGADFHRGMLHIKNVPNFEYVLIHIGNDDDDTAGCLLTGMSNNADGKGLIGQSTKAYKLVYEKVSKALINNERVKIHYKDINLIG